VYVSGKGREGSVVSTMGLVSTLVHVRRHEESLRAIALNQSNLNMYKEKENHAGEAGCYWALGTAYAAIDHLQAHPASQPRNPKPETRKPEPESRIPKPKT